ncbi:protein PF3D7_1417600-like [Sitodiplosis mosellana]|uniref:protein PF3D7_1417600-like n=1 Tax=Sitodiplosis mosellana TaxID=263140 RepID=UPI002443E707|nr:protein PF3D7_1417600-like [Sitodiplosis mosellana]
MKFVLLVLLAINLSAQARHIGNNRFRRDDNHQSETTTDKNADGPAFWLRNLVVGPPVGAPQISLNVNDKIDDSLIEFINDAQKKVAQEKEEAKKPNEGNKVESEDQKGSPPSKPNNNAKSNGEENKGSDSDGKKADATGNSKNDGSKDTPKESDKSKSDGNFGDKTSEHDDSKADKKSDDNKNSSNDKSKPKPSDDGGKGKDGGSAVGRGFGYSFR